MKARSCAHTSQSYTFSHTSSLKGRSLWGPACKDGYELYLLWSSHLEPSGVYATCWFGLHRVLVSRVTRSVLNYWWVFSYRLGGAGDGGLRGQTHLIIQSLIQFLVCVRSTLCVGVLIVRSMAAVRAIHGVLTTWRRQVGQAVIVDIQVILCGAIRLSKEEKLSAADNSRVAQSD